MIFELKVFQKLFSSLAIFRSHYQHLQCPYIYDISFIFEFVWSEY